MNRRQYAKSCFSFEIDEYFFNKSHIEFVMSKVTLESFFLPGSFFISLLGSKGQSLFNVSQVALATITDCQSVLQLVFLSIWYLQGYLLKEHDAIHHLVWVFRFAPLYLLYMFLTDKEGFQSPPILQLNRSRGALFQFYCSVLFKLL